MAPPTIHSSKGKEERMRCVTLSLVGLLLCLPGLRAHAAADSVGLGSLKGITGVGLAIQPPARELIDAGVDEDSLRTTCERLLRQSGLRVLDQESLVKADGRPILGVSVDTVKNGSQMIYSLILQLYQDAVCKGTKDPDPHRVVSWHTVTFGCGDAAWIRKGLKEQVDGFCSDWRTANPVQREAPPSGEK
jgi:hypothetical protein